MPTLPPSISFLNLTTSQFESTQETLPFQPPRPANANAAAEAVPLVLLACSNSPPSYADSAAAAATAVNEPSVNDANTASKKKKKNDNIPPTNTLTTSFHPRVAVVLGVNARWHAPLLVCRALSTLPTAWWGLRCAFTFLGELLLRDEGMSAVRRKEAWTVEKRFRVTEVFLAILWVCMYGRMDGKIVFSLCF